MPIGIREIRRVAFVEPQNAELRSKIIFIPPYSLYMRKDGKLVETLPISGVWGSLVA